MNFYDIICMSAVKTYEFDAHGKWINIKIVTMAVCGQVFVTFFLEYLNKNFGGGVWCLHIMKKIT